MSRLTNKDKNGIINSLSQDIFDNLSSEDGLKIQELVERLAQYEDLGTVEKFKQLLELKKYGVFNAYIDLQKDFIEFMNKYIKLEAQNAKLKSRLANAIDSKFKIGQEVWIFVNKNNYECFDIEDISIRYWVDGGYEYLLEEDIYTTKEEAEKRLKELEGE